MKDTKTYLTPERREEIVKELTVLKTEGRKAVAERLRHAKEQGDLSENFDYQEAREEKSRLDSRINQLEELLRQAVLIRRTAGEQTVKIGSTVQVTKGKGNARYTIVGSSEAEPQGGFISNESPIGQGLLGKKVGERVKVRTPAGEVEFEIMAIE